jgi:hypothetical protein
VPSHTEQQQNGITGRITQTRYNGMLFGLPSSLWLLPSDPAHTGWAQKYSIVLLAQNYEAPQAFQATLGWTTKLGKTGVSFDTEGVYVHGTKEVALADKNYPGNSAWLGVRPNTNYAAINTYTNDGHSTYLAWVASLNGAIKGGTSWPCRTRWRASRTSATTSHQITPRVTPTIRRIWKLNPGAAGPTNVTAWWPPRCSASRTASPWRRSSNTGRPHCDQSGYQHGTCRRGPPDAQAGRPD